jgi:hypothetical protein
MKVLHLRAGLHPFEHCWSKEHLFLDAKERLVVASAPNQRYAAAFMLV